jgi:hypothetical protein
VRDGATRRSATLVARTHAPVVALAAACKERTKGVHLAGSMLAYDCRVERTPARDGEGARARPKGLPGRMFEQMKPRRRRARSLTRPRARSSAAPWAAHAVRRCRRAAPGGRSGNRRSPSGLAVPPAHEFRCNSLKRPETGSKLTRGVRITHRRLSSPARQRGGGGPSGGRWWGRWPRIGRVGGDCGSQIPLQLFEKARNRLGVDEERQGRPSGRARDRDRRGPARTARLQLPHRDELAWAWRRRRAGLASLCWRQTAVSKFDMDETIHLC